jgi:peptidoglycan/LPS O-acetylase OafA/YrhL
LTKLLNNAKKTIINQQKNRVFGLDLIRAFAILLVLFSHGFDPFLAPHFPKLRSLIFMDGVDLFFVLSGFLIGTILLKQFNFNLEYRPKIIFSFWKRRWMRTLPNYYFILFIILLVPVIFPFVRGYKSAIQFNVYGSFLFFSQNLFYPQVNFFPEAWSLAVEEWFYLITPIILFVFFILLKNILSKKWIFLLMMLFVIITSTIFRLMIGTHLSGNIEEWDANIRRIVVTRLDSIMFGVVGAYFKFYFPTHWKNKSLFPYLNVLCIFLLFMTHFLYVKAIDNNTHFFMNTLYFSFSSMAILMILPQMDSITKPPNFGLIGIFGKIFTHISLISYSLYLTHGYLILGHIVRYKKEYFDNLFPQTQTTGIIYFIIYFVISIIVSSLLYYLIEKPFMNMRSKEL